MDTAALAWRTGNHNARNLYYVTRDNEDIHVGVMFTESLGLYVVDQLNRRDTAQPPLPGGDIGAPARRDN